MSVKKSKPIFIALLLIALLICFLNQFGKIPVTKSPFAGSFSSDFYDNREKGYDWVLFNIKERADDNFDIQVRSRTDNKKATCTYDGIGQAKGSKKLLAPLDDKVNMLITLENDGIDVWMDGHFEDRFLLMRYCSGGGSLAGKYHRIIEDN